MWFTKQADGMRAWFALTDKNGAIRTGGVAGDFTVTVVDPLDTTSVTPTVSESTTKPGLYTFLIPSLFITTNGVGDYAIVMEVDITTSPKVADVMSKVLRVDVQDFDSLPASVWAVTVDTVTAQTAMQYLLSMAAGAFTETDVSAGVKDFAFKDRAGADLFTLRITDNVGRTRTSG